MRFLVLRVQIVRIEFLLYLPAENRIDWIATRVDI